MDKFDIIKNCFISMNYIYSIVHQLNLSFWNRLWICSLDLFILQHNIRVINLLGRLCWLIHASFTIAHKSIISDSNHKAESFCRKETREEKE